MKYGISAVLGTLLAACTQGHGTVASTANAKTVAAAPVAGHYDFKGWDAYLGGGDSSQYSSLDQINLDTVGQLQVAWTVETEEGFVPRFNPIVVDGVMYLLTGQGTLTAVNAATGAKLWSHTDKGRIGNRGINMWQSADGSEKRLLYLNDGMLRALDATTGEPITTFGMGGAVDLREGLSGDTSEIRPLQTDNPGRVYKDTIIMSLPAAAYDYASAPADIHAYDVRTGALKWVFHTVPKEGEFGYETWPEMDRDKFGGVHNWSESTVDTELGLVFIPTGTARYDFYGGNRKGDNLFGNSVVALDAETGKRVWHYQTIHHDIWDRDIPQAPKLMTLQKDGKDVPVVIQATKQGYVFVFNRRTGEPWWPIVEQEVPASDVPGEEASPTQPIPTWPLPFARLSFTADEINPYVSEEDQEKLRELMKVARNEGVYTPPSLVGSITMPGHNGGTNWGGSSVDPVNKRFFVVSKQMPTFDKLFPDKRPEALEAMPNGGGDVMPYRSPVNFMLQSNGLPAINPPWSTITAYDMKSGEIIWQVPNGEVTKLAEQGIRNTGSTAPRGGPVATAGGLVFVGTSSDRMFRARDAATGKVVWEHQLDAATEGVPAVYEVDGRQYVTIAVGGDGLFAPQLGQDPPGKSRYVTFALPDGN